ncbi:hypothetical protein GCM10011362_20040 [Marinobacter halophilus]|uniref:Uncharacterized protein n=1 Tax=Marinobacter halophilus TaxID=1323740 RepID=A0A2T1K830_9GAMM|nr:hypothetical protein C7H08_14430 [Marinobacter halophilus]GGC71526.1 hypothetical protein GCM10011362_20040 [Marinobacter halophilus]
MVRAIVVVSLVIGAIALVVFGPRFLDTTADVAERPPCDLLKAPCEWTTKDGDWRITLVSTEPGTQGMEYRLSVTVPKAPDRFLAVLRGQSMYMGEYPVPLVREQPLEYQARFTAPFCTTGADMIWRIDLQDGQEKLQNVPWALVFQAQK